MLKIELTPQQVQELKEIYSRELDNLHKRAEEIREFLSKLEVKPTDVSTPYEKPSIVTTPHEEPIKKIPSWSNFIFEVLKVQQKPLSLNTIVKLYRKEYGIKEQLPKNSIKSLRQSLFLLRTKKKQIQSIALQDKKEKLYGLIEWQNEPILKSKPEKKLKPKKEAIDNIVKPQVADTSHNWTQFIIDTLNKTKRVMTPKEFLNYAVTAFSIPKHDEDQARKNLSPTLSYLAHKNKSLKTTIKKGQKGKCYGLSTWFNDEGELIPDYK
jgi:hypothetical protein